MNQSKWQVYLVRCVDGSLYCGATSNLENRLAAHNAGRGAKYTRSRGPVELVVASDPMAKSSALKLEYRIKRLPAGRKTAALAKAAGPLAETIRKDLMAVRDAIEALSGRVDRIIKEMAGSE